MVFPHPHAMLPAHRARSIALLRRARTDDRALCREVEARCHAASRTPAEYLDRVRRAAFNLRANTAVGVDVVRVDDETLAIGTEVGALAEETRARRARFEAMLQEKYEALDDRTFEAIVRCRRCGSAEVSWTEKQTRSADEASTVFASCQTCRNRWVVR